MVEELGGWRCGGGIVGGKGVRMVGGKGVRMGGLHGQVGVSFGILAALSYSVYTIYCGIHICIFKHYGWILGGWIDA